MANNNNSKKLRTRLVTGNSGKTRRFIGRWTVKTRCLIGHASLAFPHLWSVKIWMIYLAKWCSIFPLRYVVRHATHIYEPNNDGYKWTYRTAAIPKSFFYKTKQNVGIAIWAYKESNMS